LDQTLPNVTTRPTPSPIRSTRNKLRPVNDSELSEDIATVGLTLTSQCAALHQSQVDKEGGDEQLIANSHCSLAAQQS
jgi:hypothetical protein